MKKTEESPNLHYVLDPKLKGVVSDFISAFSPRTPSLEEIVDYVATLRDFTRKNKAALKKQIAKSRQYFQFIVQFLKT
jgi:hypothetical protein